MSILQMSISAGLLVIAIVLIRAIALNRLPKKMFLVLWGVVLFRLFVPVSIPLPFSVPNIINNVTSAVLPDIASPANENPINRGDMITGTPGTEIAKVAGAAGQEQIYNIAPTTAIWLVGMLALFIFFAVIYFRNHRIVRYATEIRDNDFLNEWLTVNRLTRPIAIMQSDRIETPLAVGIFKPRIILPKSMDLNDQQLLKYVLTHEYFHVKRHDAVWKMLLLLALCVHWFNPIVWLMFVLASRDLELTCDEAVIYRFGVETKKAYAYMLIGLAEQRAKFAPLFNGFSKNATQERIVSIMKIKKPTLLAVILAIVLVSALTIGVLAATAANNDNAQDPYTPGTVSNITDDDTAPVETGGGKIDRNTFTTGNPGNIDILAEKMYYNLTQQGRLQVTATDIFNYQVYTNSTEIKITIPSGEHEGTFYLYDVNHAEDPIAEFVLDRNNRTKAFSNLTSAKNYYIVASGINESVTITISD